MMAPQYGREGKRCYVCDTTVSAAWIETLDQEYWNINSLPDSLRPSPFNYTALEDYAWELGLENCSGDDAVFYDLGNTVVCANCHARGMRHIREERTLPLA